MKKLKETTPNMVNLPHKSCKLLLIKILITIGNNNNKSNFNNNNNNNNNDNNNNNNNNKNNNKNMHHEITAFLQHCVGHFSRIQKLKFRKLSATRPGFEVGYISLNSTIS